MLDCRTSVEPCVYANIRGLLNIFINLYDWMSDANIPYFTNQNEISLNICHNNILHNDSSIVFRLYSCIGEKAFCVTYVDCKYLWCIRRVLFYGFVNELWQKFLENGFEIGLKSTTEVIDWYLKYGIRERNGCHDIKSHFLGEVHTSVNVIGFVTHIKNSNKFNLYKMQTSISGRKYY